MPETRRSGHGRFIVGQLSAMSGKKLSASRILPTDPPYLPDANPAL